MNNNIKPGTKLLCVKETDWYCSSKVGDVIEIRYIMNDGTLFSTVGDIVKPHELVNFVPDFIYNSPLYNIMKEK